VLEILREAAIAHCDMIWQRILVAPLTGQLDNFDFQFIAALPVFFIC
jgi:hypothetical protein